MTTVALWRCASCGKWSHARRRPKWHERFIPAGQVVHDDLHILREEGPSYDYEGNGPEGGTWVACGPFAEWTATPKIPAAAVAAGVQ